VRSASRLASLRATALMDGDAEEDFDRFTRLASKLLNAPVALVSLVDDRRQFFKSAVGLGVRETPITHSFCAHVVTARTPLVLGDARAHPLVKENPVIDELGVAAYAGVPLMSADDEALGSFCVVDVKPRSWTADEMATLHELAIMVAAQIDMRRTLQELERRACLVDALVESSDDGILLLDLDLVIEGANPSFCALVQRSEADLVGKPFVTLKAATDIASSFALREELLSGRKPEVRVQARYLRSDGTTVLLAASARAVRDASGAPKAIWLRARPPVTRSDAGT
jgi:PAS domain S-box-containing protein